MGRTRPAAARARGRGWDDETRPLLLPPTSEPIHVPTVPATSDIAENGIASVDLDSRQKPEMSASAIISVLLIGVFVANIDGTLVLATYGRIASEFNDLENASWLVTSYVLSMSAAQPLYGKLSDIYGRRDMLLIAYTIFGLGCAVSAFGQSLPAVVTGRLIAGLGGGGMDSVVSILITDLVPVRDVGSWRGYVNIIATSGRAMGGPVGGFLADTIGWRWSFLGQCPLTLLAIACTWLLVPNRVPPSANSDEVKSKLSRIDFAGAFLLASTILFFLLPLQLGGGIYPWNHPLISGLLTASVILAILFVIVESSWAEDPIFALRFLRSRNIIIPNIVVFFQTSAQLGMMYTVPIYFQVTQEASATLAASHLMPAVAGVALSGLIGGYLMRRTGRYKTLLTCATVISSTSYLLLFLDWHGHTNWWKSLYIFPGGFGHGIVQSAAFVALTAGISSERVAMACSTFFLASNTACVVGMASTSAVLQAALRSGLESRLGGIPNSVEIIDKVLSNLDYIQSLEGEVKDIVIGVYTTGLEYAHAINFGCAAVAFFASFLIREVKL